MVMKGVFIFFIATLVSVIVYLIGSTLLDVLSDPTDANALTTDQQAIGWLAMIIIWIIIMLILPAYYIIEGIKDTEE